jgi:hypothetical protein
MRRDYSELGDGWKPDGNLLSLRLLLSSYHGYCLAKFSRRYQISHYKSICQIHLVTPSPVSIAFLGAFAKPPTHKKTPLPAMPTYNVTDPPHEAGLDSEFTRYTNLDGYPNQKDVLHILRRLVNLVQPLRRHRGWRIDKLSEMAPQPTVKAGTPRYYIGITYGDRTTHTTNEISICLRWTMHVPLTACDERGDFEQETSYPRAHDSLRLHRK